MKIWKWVLGAVIIVLGIVAAILAAGNSILYFVDILSAVVLALFTLPALIGIHGWKGYWDAFRLPFRKDRASRSDYDAAVAVLDSSIRMLYVAALLGTLIGTIGILAYLQKSPDGAADVGNYAVAMITVFYAMIVHLAVLEPLRSRLRRLAALADD